MHHCLLINEVKILFEKNKKDCKRRLEKLVCQYFPNLHGFNVNARSELLEGNTLLNLCTRHGRYACIHFLLKRFSADVEVADDGGFTPFLNACYRGDLAVVKLLYAYRACPDVTGCLR